jgi:hypothetical protein
MVKNMDAYVLKDDKGRYVTDKNGNIRFWYSYKMALQDAQFISQKLKVNVKPEKLNQAPYMSPILHEKWRIAI